MPKCTQKCQHNFFGSSDCLLFFIFGYSTDMLKAWINLNFVQIQSLPKELADLEHLKNRIIFGVVTHVLFFFLFILADNEHNHKILKRFKFPPDRTKDCGVSCPWASGKISHRILVGEKLWPF